jgi:Calcineurin-like phosphoesterase
MSELPIHNFKIYPRMAHWFSPVLLFKLLQNVILSSIFGSYADRRLLIAALDTTDRQKLIQRAQETNHVLNKEPDGTLWLDFVADLGDGFDSTYSVATLLARKELLIGDKTLPRGQALILGGDEVYPKATPNAYMYQLYWPYVWASPDSNPDDDAGTPLFAIPGNHDWYDGLTLFLAWFCRHKTVHFGSWRTVQRRSYFANQLTDKWWLWAIDIQLADNMDQPQADYFKLIAEEMPENSKIILCSAEPGWLYVEPSSESTSWEIVEYAIEIAQNSGRGLTVPIVMSGDTHHYNRYKGPNNTQYITSGGGGAFLHPTHQLEDTISLKRCGLEQKLDLARSSDRGFDPAVYPSFEVSKSLVWRNLYFALTNWDFSILMGAIYFLFGIAISLRPHLDMYLVTIAVFASSLMGYTIKQEKSKRRAVLITSALHSLAHAALVIFAGSYFSALNAAHFAFDGPYGTHLWLCMLFIEMFPIGLVLGSSFFGWNMMITCRFLRMNRNDAFSALRIGMYNNFVRMRITDDNVEFYVVGLDVVPSREDWQDNPKHHAHTPDEPRFVLKTPLKPHLIESFSLGPNKLSEGT